MPSPDYALNQMRAFGREYATWTLIAVAGTEDEQSLDLITSAEALLVLFDKLSPKLYGFPFTECVQQRARDLDLNIPQENQSLSRDPVSCLVLEEAFNHFLELRAVWTPTKALALMDSIAKDIERKRKSGIRSA